MKPYKTILDTVTVRDKAFPLNRTKDELSIVSVCTKCGSPIYGKQNIGSNEKPEVKMSCNCTFSKEFQDSIVTK